MGVVSSPALVLVGLVLVLVSGVHCEFDGYNGMPRPQGMSDAPTTELGAKPAVKYQGKPADCLWYSWENSNYLPNDTKSCSTLLWEAMKADPAGLTGFSYFSPSDDFYDPEADEYLCVIGCFNLAASPSPGSAAPPVTLPAAPVNPPDTAPPPQVDTAPPSQGDTAPPPQGDTAPSPQGDTAPSPQGDTAPPPQATAPTPQEESPPPAPALLAPPPTTATSPSPVVATPSPATLFRPPPPGAALPPPSIVTPTGPSSGPASGPASATSGAIALRVSFPALIVAAATVLGFAV